jgi:hypothetical protein
MTDRTTDDETRWAEALTSLEHGPTPAIRARVRRQRRLVLGIAGAGLLVAVLVPLLLPDRPERSASDDTSTALEVAGLVVMGAAVLLEAAALVLMFRAWRGRWISPLRALTSRQNRQLSAQVQGKAPVVPEHLPLTRHVAETMVLQRPVLVLLLGIVLLLLGTALLTSSWGWAAAAAAYAVLALVGRRMVRRNERTARRFLAEHPEPAP